MKTQSYCIAINGQKAVDASNKFCGGYCYHGLYNSVNGEKIAQIETVIDEPGEYNGFTKKWVDVSYIAEKDIKTVLSYLKSLGFDDCFYELSLETIIDDCYIQQKQIETGKI